MLMPLIGGALIGLASALLYVSLGRIAGISGIMFDAFGKDGIEWRLPFLSGLVAGAWAAALAGFALPEAQALSAASAPPLIAAGLAVGAGARLGNGCTSGHGICGIARLSPRSFAAVALFMAVGVLSATFVRGALQ